MFVTAVVLLKFMKVCDCVSLRTALRSRVTDDKEQLLAQLRSFWLVIFDMNELIGMRRVHIRQ